MEFGTDEVKFKAKYKHSLLHNLFSQQSRQLYSSYITDVLLLFCSIKLIFNLIDFINFYQHINLVEKCQFYKSHKNCRPFTQASCIEMLEPTHLFILYF